MSNGAAGGTSRRQFLGRAAGAAAAVAGAGMGAGAIAQNAAAASRRNYTAGNFALQLDSVNCGGFKSMDGGDVANAVVNDPLGSDRIQHKHLGGLTRTDCTIQVGSGMRSGMYDWIKAAFDHGFDSSAQRRTSVSALGANNVEVARRRFASALITEVTIPALDVSSTEVATIGVTFSSSQVTDLRPSGSTVRSTPQKAWLCSNFRLDIDGLQTGRVASIDSFTWKCSLADDGSLVLDVGKIGVTSGAGSAPSWQKWLANQQNGAVDERNGTLTIVGASGGGVLTLSLVNLGLYQIRPAHPIGGAPNGFFRGELYVEKLVAKFS